MLDETTAQHPIEQSSAVCGAQRELVSNELENSSEAFNDEQPSAVCGAQKKRKKKPKKKKSGIITITPRSYGTFDLKSAVKNREEIKVRMALKTTPANPEAIDKIVNAFILKEDFSIDDFTNAERFWAVHRLQCIYSNIRFETFMEEFHIKHLARSLKLYQKFNIKQFCNFLPNDYDEECFNFLYGQHVSQ